MNMVGLVGNLATDPELRHTGDGRSVCTFRLAVSRPNGKEADFFTVVTWERQAEVMKEFLKVGRRVSVEGRLRHSVWTADEARRSKVEVVAHRVEMLGGAPPRTAPDVDFAPVIDAPAPDAASEFAVV